MDEENNKPEQREEERPAEDFLEEAAEGLWLRLRDIILVIRKLERFVF